MSLPEKKLTLPVILAIVGLLIQLCWIYLQVRHWKEPNADYEAILINVGVTVTLWAVLASFIIRSRNTLAHSLRQELAGIMWVWWSTLADEYEHLDYDNRTNTSTRLPFDHSSWPNFGSPWTYVHVKLYVYNQRAQDIKRDTDDLVQWLGWNDIGNIPTPASGTLIIDFIRQCRDFQAYIERKLFP